MQKPVSRLRDQKPSLSCAAIVLMTLAALPANALKIGAGGDPVPVDLAATFDPASDPAVAAKTYIVDIDSPKFGKVKKVAIWHYCMRYITNKGATGTSSGATISFSRSVEGGFPGGLSEAAARSVADTYYDQLEADLRAAGIEVVPYAQLETTAPFQKYSKGWTQDAKYGQEDADFGNQKGVKGMQQFAMVSAHGRKFDKDCALATVGNQMNIARAAADAALKDITLIGVVATMDYATLKARGGFFNGAKADMDYGQFLVPGPTNTAVLFRGGTNSSYWLKQGIVAKDNPFVVGGTSKQKLKTELQNEYNPNSATTTTSSQSTSVGSDEVLWRSNAEAQVKGLSAMIAALVKKSR